MLLPMTGPKAAPRVADSNSPSSLEVPMKRLFTAETRPRFSSGVSNCTSVCRITTLILSTTPQRNSIRNDSQNQRDSPNPIVATPNAVDRPAATNARLFGSAGRCARMNVHTSEPTGRASCKKPSPNGSRPQNQVSVNGQQRRGAAKQHRKHVQRNDSQNNFVLKNEVKSSQQRS